MLLTDLVLITGSIFDPVSDSGLLDDERDFYDHFDASTPPIVEDLTGPDDQPLFTQAIISGTDVNPSGSTIVIGDQDGFAYTRSGAVIIQQIEVGTWTGTDVEVHNPGANDITVINSNGDSDNDVEVTGDTAGDTLVVFTTPEDDRVTVESDTITVGDVTDQRDTIEYTGFEHVRIDTFVGIDSITVIDTHAGSTTINAGRGNDLIAVRKVSGVTNVNGDAGEDLIVASTTAGLALGDDFAEIGFATDGRLDDIGAALNIDGGEGDDRFQGDDTGESDATNTHTLDSTTLDASDMAGTITYLKPRGLHPRPQRRHEGHC